MIDRWVLLLLLLAGAEASAGESHVGALFSARVPPGWEVDVLPLGGGRDKVSFWPPEGEGLSFGVHVSVQPAGTVEGEDFQRFRRQVLGETQDYLAGEILESGGLPHFGFDSFQIVYRFKDDPAQAQAFHNLTRYVLVDQEIYRLSYDADAALYPRYLSQALSIIDSVHFNHGEVKAVYLREVRDAARFSGRWVMARGELQGEAQPRGGMGVMRWLHLEDGRLPVLLDEEVSCPGAVAVFGRLDLDEGGAWRLLGRQWHCPGGENLP